MLDGFKKLYSDKADIIKGWKSLSKSELCNLYLEEKEKGSDLADCYLSAIVCNFWNNAVRHYYSQQVKEAEESDCYNYLIDGILYALNHHVWLDPSNSLYGDPKGPEKAINVVLSSLKYNIYAYNSRYKRRLRKESLSLDSIQDYSYRMPNVTDKCDDGFLDEFVRTAFNRKEYFKAFMVDAIVHGEVFDKSNGAEFNQKKLRCCLRKLNEDDYCKTFSETYKINNIPAVERASGSIIDMPQSKMDSNIRRVFYELKHNRAFLSYLRGN